LPGYGASEGIHAALTCVLDPGENVLTPSPGYPQYTALVNLLGGEVNAYQCDEDTGWEPHVPDMRKQVNDKTQAIVLINPNNPTGGVYSKEKLKRIVDLAAECELPIITDEIYSKLVHDPDASFTSVLEVAGDVPVLKMGGLSKNYLAPGWRTGWAIRYDPQNVLGKVWQGMQQLARVRLSTTHPMQHAIKPALAGPQTHLGQVRGKLRKRAEIIHERVNEIEGLSVEKPRGAFYAFVKIEDRVMQHFESDKDFVYSLLRETGVLTVHGSGFGSGVAENHFRVVFLPDEGTLEAACDKIQSFVGTL